MDLQQLAKLSDAEVAKWVRSNSDKHTLITDIELEEIIGQRDTWEEKATELALDVGTLLNTEVGEHSNVNNSAQKIWFLILILFLGMVFCAFYMIATSTNTTVHTACGVVMFFGGWVSSFICSKFKILHKPICR